jgi:hypothetical protein
MLNADVIKDERANPSVRKRLSLEAPGTNAPPIPDLGWSNIR